MLNLEDSVVLIIDVQEKLLNAVYDKELCYKNAVIMSKAAQILDIPVVITEQYPKGLGSTVAGICGTNIFEKTSFSAFEEIKTALEGRKQIVVFGIETHICVNQTVESLLKAGFEVHVVKDASSSRMEAEHLAGLERMRDNGAHILTTEIALFEWLGTSKHPKFKDVQKLIK